MLVSRRLADRGDTNATSALRPRTLLRPLRVQRSLPALELRLRRTADERGPRDGRRRGPPALAGAAPQLHRIARPAPVAGGDRRPVRGYRRGRRAGRRPRGAHLRGDERPAQARRPRRLHVPRLPVSPRGRTGHRLRRRPLAAAPAGELAFRPVGPPGDASPGHADGDRQLPAQPDGRAPDGGGVPRDPRLGARGWGTGLLRRDVSPARIRQGRPPAVRAGGRRGGHLPLGHVEGVRDGRHAHRLARLDGTPRRWRTAPPSRTTPRSAAAPRARCSP